MCGAVPGDVDDETGQIVILRFGRVVSVGMGLKGALADFDVLCSSCYQGAKEIIEERVRLTTM
jgi:hypothetical protein